MASSVQQNVYKVLSSIGCTRVCVSQIADSNSFELTYAHNLKLVIYGFCDLNFLLKVSFVVLLSFGKFEPITEFFDWIAILLWFLIIGMILTSERLFYQKYPFFEILCAGWSYQESLYQHLIDKGEDFKSRLHSLAYSRVFLQSWIALLGSAAMLFQYLAAPKYCVFTYSAIEQDSVPLYILFGAHELLFIFHGWQFYGGIIYVSSCFGAELILCIKTLTDVLNSLPNGEFEQRYVEVSRFVKLPHNTHPKRLPSTAFGSVNSPRKSMLQHQQLRSGPGKCLEDIMLEYRKLTIWSDRINEYASYNFLVIHGLAYCQMVSDVFVMIQLLRMAETDIVSIIFFAEDAGVCMYMLFKVFKSMAFVTAASDEYLQELRVNLRSSRLAGLERSLLRRMYKSLRKVQMKIGPTTVGPGMVGNAMMTLLNNYICAAMW